MSLNKFPLRLVAFEEYFLHNHRDNRPATFYLRIDFAQKLDRGLSETALELTCHRHPLSRCVVNQSSRRPHWERCNQLPELRWQDKPARLEAVNRDLDITSQPGIRIFAFDGVERAEKSGLDSIDSSNENEASASLLFVVHHVLFDGLGFLQWLSDWVHCYRALQLEPKHDVAIKFAELPLPKRCRPDLGFFEALRLLPGQCESVRETFQILRRTVIQLIPPKLSKTLKVQAPGFARLHFSADETMRLKTVSSEKGISLNSMLASDLFATIAKWQTKTGEMPEGSHLRVMVPINERSRKHRTMASCNHCTIINLDRSRDEVSEPEELANGIDQELSLIARWKLSLNFWRAIELIRMLSCCHSEPQALASESRVVTPVSPTCSRHRWLPSVDRTWTDVQYLFVRIHAASVKLPRIVCPLCDARPPVGHVARCSWLCPVPNCRPSTSHVIRKRRICGA